ncbi:hypothetical protein PUN28_003262 [Cardiocondyla obscurior]|uniref:Uncharacterized protein n=1 Tax=Cardiocondyla obscurior TaxID=286306 RepID=A0AAW2GI26_9HYME
MSVVCIPGYIYRHNKAATVVDYMAISYALVQNARSLFNSVLCNSNLSCFHDFAIRYSVNRKSACQSSARRLFRARTVAVISRAAQIIIANCGMEYKMSSQIEKERGSAIGGGSIMDNCAE